MLHCLLLTVALAAAEPKIGTSGPADAKHMVLTSPPGVFIESESGTFEVTKRFAELESAAAVLSTATETIKADADSTKAAFAKYKEAVEGSCPAGSMVTGRNADGTATCEAVISDDEWQRKVTVPCKGSAVLQSLNKDGTPVCVDPTPDEKEFQRRLASGCPDGQVVREVLVNGTVLCDAVSPELDGDRRSVYTVWGSQSCKEQSDLVYTGWMAGASYRHGGSGANYLCMAMDGGKYTDAKWKYGAEYTAAEIGNGNQDGALLYQVEWRYSSTSAGLRYNYYFTETNPNRRSGRQMACAVCEAKSPTSIEVSGRTECPANYNTAQKGRLMGAYSTHKIQGPACIEEFPEAMRWDRSKDSYGQATTATMGGAYIYPAETHYPPGGVGEGYTHNFEIPCIKCNAVTNKQASVFTRFGHRDCPTKTKLIYTGWTAGGVESQSGHGAKRLCMPAGVQYTGAENRNENNGLNLVRTRYRTTFQTGQAIKAQNYREVACAVCEAPSAAVQVVPGAQTCPAGYDANYKGYLMSSRYDMYGSDFICVDEALQNIRSETVSNNDPRPTDESKPNPNPMRDMGTGRTDGLYMVDMDSSPTSAVAGGVSKYANGKEASCISCRKADPVAKAAVFTQWGKRTCGGGAKTLVSGWMANGKYWHRGGGHNYQCMSKVAADPKAITAGFQTGGRLSRVEYKSDAVQGTIRTAFKKAEYADAACAICEAEAEDTLMVPGRQTCPTGYSPLYNGYISGARYNHQHKSEFICLDTSFQAVKGSSKGNQNTGFIYLTETEMSSPSDTYTQYAHNKEIPCVVCAVN